MANVFERGTESNARANLSDPEENGRGLSAEKRVKRFPAGTASPNSTGREESFLQPDAG